VNVVLVAEGEEEIGSPHFAQIVRRADVSAALAKCRCVITPEAAQDQDGEVEITLGAKGVIECELTSSGERWGRGPKKDVHSSYRACVDSPAWRLVQALATLVNADGDPAVDGFADKVRGLSAAEKQMVADKARRMNEATLKSALGVERWAHDMSFERAIEAYAGLPTINIEGLVGGYTGQGGKTVLPHEARAKIDMRLVPDMTAGDTIAKLKAHLVKRGFGDVDVNMTGGYDPSTTPSDAPYVRAELALYKRAGIDPVVSPRSGGSWPGYLFTGAPLSLAAGGFGLGHGDRAHAPDEYYVIDSIHPKVRGYVAAAQSFVDLLYELA
jgi:acetylornithine deacetylase/succinyl-diaminopimelate desuccinylase-like protein